MSISFMLIRIASNKRKYTYSLYAVSAMFTAMNLIAMLYIIFHCRPVQYAWDTTIKGGKCNAAKILADIYYATTAVNITTDWFCALLPIPLLWQVALCTCDHDRILTDVGTCNSIAMPSCPLASFLVSEFCEFYNTCIRASTYTLCSPERVCLLASGLCTPST
jgi:hypothetical protein